MSGKKILQLEDIRREFIMGSEVVKALRGITFDVYEGEFVTIMGSSGSGKTTLLNILGCLDKPTSGNYLLDGVSVSKLSRNELARLRNRKIGFVFQSYNLLPRTSALENVELPLFYNPGLSTSERKQRAMAALSEVKLQGREEHMPNQLSGGQQQRVAIARALVNQPVMILADEATGNLDSRTSYEIMALMQELNQQEGKTIVFVTHEPDIASFSTRTVMLRDGRVVKDTKNENVRSAKEALAALPPADDY
ncbi:putative ABC transport system ATP-binding protein [Chitinophaga terrae (ex Kim and Jung 2007)]|jgi:putative ABC transport system ATP-binding protein|uniref:Putative ABC transport system ATP-binding protein n=1 Tax=Chitinophaga terrae (ex Kim and Jung 2007) TaxID=408074 RepID=A0A1H3XYX8_9BACT|nr:ABC transporter ATP-binding protein [Chitinophaga terrae (ex Kim and Jung 2007)]GEP89489.1 ABC transporter ATP-binding protein [Chitinophaga terrae (ex Kim and Jung 2007)]SEA04667.1 putative ABC transport system ATP-binding protein [Chitinophaga terrae (ex Kim and Jung 2007)]